MSHGTRNLVLTTLVVICASSVLATRRHPRHYSSNHHYPSFIGDNRSYRTKVTTIFPEYDTSYLPSNTDDCVRPEVRFHSDASAYHLHDGQFYDKRCLKTLVHLVEPGERVACRTQSDCHHAQGYDNECLIQLSLDQGFDFDFDEIRRQELEWKTFVCHGKTLDQCGRDHSPWWRSRFPSFRDDCRMHGRVDKRQGWSNDNWVPWSIDPHGTFYDNDCLSRFANGLGMENPRNCTQSNTYVSPHEAREAPPVELPKTLLYATNPSGIQPHLVFPTVITDPDRLTATPTTTYIPIPKGSITDSVIPEPLTTSIPIGRRRKRDDFPPSLVRTFTQSADTQATSLPLVSRAHGSADVWSCMWNVNVTLPGPAPGMFDAAFGNGTIEKTSLVAQGVDRGELEDLRECSDTIGEEMEKSLIG